jgi:hypothetical protein
MNNEKQQTEHLGSSDSECRERRIAEEQRFLEAAYQSVAKERDEYRAERDEYREVLIRIMEAISRIRRW